MAPELRRGHPRGRSADPVPVFDFPDILRYIHKPMPNCRMSSPARANSASPRIRETASRPRRPSRLGRLGEVGLLAALLAALVAGCATFGSPARRESAAPPAAEKPATEVQRRVAESAAALVGRKRLTIDGRRFRYDCTGTILAAHYAAGIDLEAEFDRYTGNGVLRLYKLAGDHGLIREGDTPRPGDVVFWDNTYDRNGDGRWNDSLTHAGIVIRSYGDGRVDYVHHNYREGIVVARMDLGSPEVHRTGGRLVNSPMRMKSDRHLEPSRWLASHLYRSRGMLYRL